MREGTIRAWAAERRDSEQLKTVLPYLAVLSLIPYGVVARIVSSLSPSIWIEFDASGWGAYVFPSLVVITAVSLVYLWMTGRGIAEDARFYELSWVDTRELGGTLQISYVNQKNRGREGLIVKGIKAYPAEPFTVHIGSGKFSNWEPITLLGSSMTIKFQRTIFCLQLGFPNPEALNEAYQQIRGISG